MNIGGKTIFHCLNMKDFLTDLAKKVQKNTTSFDNHQRMYIAPAVPGPQEDGAPLQTKILYKHLQVQHPLHMVCISASMSPAAEPSIMQAQETPLRSNVCISLDLWWASSCNEVYANLILIARCLCLHLRFDVRSQSNFIACTSIYSCFSNAIRVIKPVSLPFCNAGDAARRLRSDCRDRR